MGLHLIKYFLFSRCSSNGKKVVTKLSVLSVYYMSIELDISNKNRLNIYIYNYLPVRAIVLNKKISNL